MRLLRDECLERGLHWRHHGKHRKATHWLVEKYSSAIAFDGWKDLGAGERFTPPPSDAPLVVWRRRTWLLTTGWLRHGLVRLREMPGGDTDDD